MKKFLLLSIITFVLALQIVEGVAIRNRFDSFYFICPQDTTSSTRRTVYKYEYQCPDPGSGWKSSLCQCQQDFDLLNSVPNHYLATLGVLWPAAIKNHSNVGALQVDHINDGFRKMSGDKWAKAVWDKQTPKWFLNKVDPKVFILNEVSYKMWQTNVKGYREWLLAFVKTLRVSYHRTVILMFPIMFPKGKSADMRKLAQYAKIGVEAYLDSRVIANKTKGQRSAWMDSLYQKSLKAYQAQGIKKAQLVYWEHYGFTEDSKAYGMSNVSKSDFLDIINRRAPLMKKLNVWGFGSYGWFGNGAQVSNADRIEYYNAYNAGAVNLP